MSSVVNLAVNQVSLQPLNINQSIWSDNSLPSNIPSAKSFIGREAELKALREAKQKGKTAFVLHGLGGVGKTGLALQFISEVIDEFQAHILVDMRGLDEKPLSPNEAMLEIVRAFEPDVPADLSEQIIKNFYVDFLNRYKTLILLDNARDRKQVEPLNHSKATIVITSRNNFNVSGGFSKEIRQMLPEDARELLYLVAGEKRLEGKADELAALAGDLPMALLSLASLLAEDNMLKASDLVQKYCDRKEARLLLDDTNLENLTIDASFDLSYECLSDELRTYWRKLAVFPTDFDLKAMKAIWQIEDAKEILSELVNRGLLFFDRKVNRASLHYLAHDYALNKLSPIELFETERFYATHYGEVLKNLSIITLENLAKFDIERVNIEKGFSWVKDKIEKQNTFASLCLLYTGYAIEILRLKLQPREFIKWMEVGILACRKIGYPAGESNQLLNLAIAYRNLGEYQKAIEYYKQALVISRKIGDRQGEGSSLGNLGNAYLDLGEYRKAVEYYEQALAISRKIGNRQGEGSSLGNLGNVYLSFGEYLKAIEYYERALAISKEIGDRQGEGFILGNLGNAYLSLDEYQKAIKYYERALAISKEIGDRQGEGSSLGNLGNVYLSFGEYLKAIEYYERALVISKEIGNRQNEGIYQGNLGNAYLSLDEYQKAIKYYERALAISKEIGDRQGEGIYLGNLGNACWNLGRYKKAIEYYEQALAISGEIGDRQGEGLHLGNLGSAYWSTGEKEKAKTLMKEALAIFEIVESPNAGIVRSWMREIENE